MTSDVLAVLRCGVCGTAAALVETVAPGRLPAGWDEWGEDRRRLFEQYRDPERWQLLFEGVAAGNGWVGDPIDVERARVLHEAFREPHAYARVRTAGFHDGAGFCGPCDRAYCSTHWNLTVSGAGTCPEGHRRSLDPHGGPG